MKKSNISQLNGRLQKAKKFLQNHSHPKDLVKWYMKKYKVSAGIAESELIQIGYEDDIKIQYYEKEDIEWEYLYHGYTGEMYVVPKGTKEWDLY